MGFSQVAGTFFDIPIDIAVGFMYAFIMLS
jgi:hypothetical protein